jgi:hypothetical protein
MHAEFDSLHRVKRLEGRFRERVWPVFVRPRQKRHKRLPLPSPCNAKWTRSMHRAIRIELGRKWLSLHPLERQWERTDEAFLAPRSG